MYVELHCASAFSFLQGASLPELLIDRAAELEYPALALLDRDGVYGCPRFHKAALAAGIKPIIGGELTLDLAGQAEAGRAGQAGRAGWAGWAGRGGHRGSAYSTIPPIPPVLPFVLPVLCESQQGYQNLCRLITRMKMRAPKGEGALTLDDLDGHVGGLVALVGRAALAGHRFGVGGLVDRLVGIFGRDRVYVDVQRHFRRDEQADNRTLVDLAGAFHVPVIATNGVRFAEPRSRPLFDVLTCIHHHTDLVRAGRRLAPNAERYLKSPAEMAALFADMPEAVARTRELADRLQYTMADLGYRFPDYPVPPGETQASFLRKIADVGARERYRPYHDRARAQIARELDLIEKLELAGYFLIVWDIVNFCRQHDILVQGRGSAANSAVCYSLGITAVDPVKMDLLFERFLSEERGEWPDIDLDLPSGDRRERVIQHVYEKYNSRGAAPEGPRAAMTANVITYRGRSAAREVGKALGIDEAQIDRLAKVMGHFEFRDQHDTLPKHLSTVGLDLDSDRVRLFASLWHQMQDLPRHLGQHSGGMVLCRGQLDAVVPLENASMPGRVVVQWDKDDCADMGIVKVDLLGLGMMAVLEDTIKMIPEVYAEEVDLAHLPPDDPVVYETLQKADTVGM
ncbi:MAG TPA: PHP domain-containing protein, partial [Vicinamibacterales bacterium]|nr:PHP domain-containing protein [Vicinamibacterales bacterium]